MHACTSSQKWIARSNFLKLLNETRYDKKAEIKFIDLLKIEWFYFVLFLRISLRFKVTEVKKKNEAMKQCSNERNEAILFWLLLPAKKLVVKIALGV